MTNHLKIAAATALLAVLAAPSLAATDYRHPDHIYLRVLVDVDKGGNFYGTEPVTVTVPQATEAGCLVFTGDKEACAAFAPAMGGRAHPVPRDRQDGINHSGIFAAPTGFDICRVRIEWADALIDADSSFATEILRDADRNGLGYDIRPVAGPRTEHAVTAMVDLDFIKTDLAADPANGCFPTGSKPWDCHGKTDACVEAEAKG